MCVLSLKPAPNSVPRRRGGAAHARQTARALGLPKNCSCWAKVGGSAGVFLPSESCSSRVGVALSGAAVAAPHSLCPPKLLCLLRDPYGSCKGSGGET